MPDRWLLSAINLFVGRKSVSGALGEPKAKFPLRGNHYTPWEPTARCGPRLVARFALLSNSKLKPGWQLGMAAVSVAMASVFFLITKRFASSWQEWSWNPASSVGDLGRGNSEGCCRLRYRCINDQVIVASSHQEWHMPALQCPECRCCSGVGAWTENSHRAQAYDRRKLLSH